MSYMDNEMVWAGAEMQELSLEEIEDVNGGWIVIAAVVVICVSLVIIGACGAHNKANAAEG